MQAKLCFLGEIPHVREYSEACHTYTHLSLSLCCSWLQQFTLLIGMLSAEFFAQPFVAGFLRLQVECDLSQWGKGGGWTQLKYIAEEREVFGNVLQAIKIV
jgi:hypothetical protein